MTVSPASATYSKTSAADVVFTVVGATSIASVKKGSSTLTATTDYTYSSGTLTIKSAYLGALDNGAVTLDITADNGITKSVVITVAA